VLLRFNPFIKKFVFLNMTTIQLKTEIQNFLEKVPEDVLPEVLAFLKDLQQQPGESQQLSNFMKQTLIEDKELLEKLAQ
jgi:hypothetical protein